MNTSNVCRLLVVDDNADTVETLAMLLRLSGHEVVVANDGITAIEQAASFRPDVVLLDLGLPQLHGHDVCRQILEKVSPHRPLMIAVTGHGQREIQEESYRAGFDAHMLKPVNFDELERLIQDHCETRKASC
jgi:CheY-like chemotaxis protein